METQDKLKMEIAERLEKIRILINFNQSKFASSLEMKPGSYSDIKRGKAGLSKRLLNLIEKKHNVNLEWLLNNKGNIFNSDQKLIIQDEKNVNEPRVEYKTIDRLLTMLEKKDVELHNANERIRELEEKLSNNNNDELPSKLNGETG